MSTKQTNGIKAEFENLVAEIEKTGASVCVSNCLRVMAEADMNSRTGRNKQPMPWPRLKVMNQDAFSKMVKQYQECRKGSAQAVPAPAPAIAATA